VRKIATLRQALGDPDLLAHALPGPSWAAWRTLLLAIVGEELLPDEREIFKNLTGGREIEPGVMIDIFLAVAGRRSGKSAAAAALLVYLACLCDWSDVLSLGERGLGLFLAPSERQAATVHRYAVAILDASPALRGLIENRTADTITLSCGCDLEVQPASWRRSRGGTAIGIVLDECAFLQTSDDSANTDQQILTALKPSLATTGGPMLLTSSPSTMEGIVYKLHKRHFGPEGDARVLVIQSDTRSLNPSLSQKVIDRAYELDAVEADAEFGGVFRQLSTAYLERAIVERATDATSVRLTLPGLPYVAFLDPSGGTGKDSFTAAIGHKVLDNGREIGVLDALLEFQPPFDPDTVVKQISDTLKRWGISEAVSDAYAAAWPISAFARHGISLTHASLSASEIYVHVIPQFTSGRVRLLNHQRLIDQLCALKRKVGQAGREIVSHPRNQHDDLANSVCGLLWRLSPGGPASPADNFLEYMRRELVRATGADIPGPAFGYGFGQPPPKPEQLIKLMVPAGIAGGYEVPIDGTRYSFRYDGGRAYVSVTRDHALKLMTYDFWADANSVASAALEIAE
jgi:hypothetical protein